MEAAMKVRDTSWFIYDDGYGSGDTYV